MEASQELSVLNRCMAESKENQQAIADATKAIALDPHGDQGYLIRAICELELGKIDDCLADCNAALAINGGNGEAQKIKSQAEKAIAHGKSSPLKARQIDK